MNIQKFLFATVAGGLVMWLLAGLWHMVIMADFYKQFSYAAEGFQANTSIIGLGFLVLALLMAYIYPIGYKGGSPVVEGLKFGVLIGLLWVLPHGIVLIGAEGAPAKIAFIDSAWHLVEEGIGGIVMGLIYGKGAAAVKAS